MRAGRKWIRSIWPAVVVCTLSHPGAAAPLSFVPQHLTQPDGTTVECFASGDEYYNWLHDEAGYTIVQDPGTGYFVYALPGKESLVPSSMAPGHGNPAMLGVEPWLTIPSGERLARRAAFLKRAPEPSVDSPTLGSFTNLAIFIRFSDEAEFGEPRSRYTVMFNENGAGLSSMYNYFREVSYGAVSIVTNLYPLPDTGTAVVSFQDSHPRAYYQPYNAVSNPIGYQGGDDGSERASREFTLLKAAVDSIAPQIPASVNLDSDNNGRVDNVVFIVRGSPTGWASLLWPHQWSLYSVTATINGKRVYSYNLQLQSSINVGVLCHEMSHSLGMPDLYHYNSTPVTPVGSWDIMATSPSTPMHMDGYLKYKYGKWLAAPAVLTAPGTYWIRPLTSPTGSLVKIPSPYSASEFFVVEYRKKIGVFERSLPGEGLLVYRVNSSFSGNASGPPDEVYVIRPGGSMTVNGALGSAPFSSEAGRRVLNDEADPSPFLSNGSPGGLAINDVGTKGDSMSFVLGSPLTAVVDSFTAVYGRADSILVSWVARAQYRCRGFELELSDSTPVGYAAVAGGSVSGGGTTAASVRYTLVDRLNPGKKYYRIKEIDSSFAIRYSARVATVNFPATDIARVPSPERFELLQNFPNPFNPSTVVGYRVATASEVRLVLYDLLGREVRVLVHERKSPGTYNLRVDAEGLASGVYFYRMQARPVGGGEAGGFVVTRRMVVLR